MATRCDFARDAQVVKGLPTSELDPVVDSSSRERWGVDIIMRHRRRDEEEQGLPADQQNERRIEKGGDGQVGPNHKRIRGRLGARGIKRDAR